MAWRRLEGQCATAERESRDGEPHGARGTRAVSPRRALRRSLSLTQLYVSRNTNTTTGADEVAERASAEEHRDEELVDERIDQSQKTV